MHHNYISRTLATVLLLSSVTVCTGAFGLHHLSPRLQIGINLLPAVMAANTVLNSLRKDGENITAYLVYETDPLLAQGAAKKLAQVEKVRGIELLVHSVDIDELLASQVSSGSAVFMTERLQHHRKRLIEFCTANQVLLFSPFKGDVEDGIMAGFDVTNKVLPAINRSALARARINLKAFFLRIAVTHGE